MRASPRAEIVQILGDSGSERDRARGDREEESLFDIVEREARESATFNARVHSTQRRYSLARLLRNSKRGM